MCGAQLRDKFVCASRTASPCNAAWKASRWKLPQTGQEALQDGTGGAAAEDVFHQPVAPINFRLYFAQQHTRNKFELRHIDQVWEDIRKHPSEVHVPGKSGPKGTTAK